MGLIYDFQVEKMASQGAGCVMKNVTMTARAVVSLWDEAFRPLGLTANQFQILAVLATLGDSNLKGLADKLNMDTTTISRTTKLLSENGYLKVTTGSDARQKMLGLSKKGKDKFAKGVEIWSSIQESFLREAGQAEWEKTLEGLAKMRKAARKMKNGHRT